MRNPRLLVTAACLAGAAASTAVPMIASAQGSLGAQGFGYPTGQLSSGALGMGGATAEADAATPLNPAALSSLTRFAIYMQFEPEFRKTSTPDGEASTTTMRFPNFSGSGSYRRFTGGVAFSTLLDRTWSNTYEDSQSVGGVLYPSSLHASSNGAINDARFAASYLLSATIQVGIGVHAISGENRVEFGRAFPDSTGLGSVAQTSVVNYSGRAFSAGLVWRPTQQLIVGSSARFGGPLRAEMNGDSLSHAEVPSRYGLGVTYVGIPNTTLSLRGERTAWTDMRGLGTSEVSYFDATDIGLGVDVSGPVILGSNTTVRLGFRDRGLPFGLRGEQVSERSISTGLALPLSQGRAQVDIGLQRAVRKATSMTETAWGLSIGLGIRP